MALQESHDCIYCVVDLHAITQPFSVWGGPSQLAANTREVTAAFLAAGITLPDEPESSAEPAPAPTAEAPQEPVRASVEPRKVNDATFIGGDLPTSVYDLPLDIGIAGGRDAKRWPGKKMKFGEFVGSLTKHTVGEKDGKAAVAKLWDATEFVDGHIAAPSGVALEAA